MKFGQDLRRRHIFRLAGLYVVGAWVVIEVASVFFPAIVNDQRWAEALQAPEFVSLLSWVKAGLDRQRLKVETIDAEEDFRAVVERLFPEESLASTSAVG